MTDTATATLPIQLEALNPDDARWFLGCQVWQRTDTTRSGGAMAIIEQIVPPGLGSPYHIHNNDDEAFYVLEGEIRFFSAEGSYVLGAGGFAFLPKGIAHGFRTEGDTASRSLLMTMPSGFDQFVAELSTVEPPAGPPDMDALMAAAGRHGLDILGPLPE